MAVSQGSRAGLITSVVTLSIVSVVAIIFAFWFGAERNKSDKNLAELKTKYQDVVSEGGLASPEVDDLRKLRQEGNVDFNPQMKLLDVAIKQRDQLIKLITEKDASKDYGYSNALKDSTSALTAVAEKIKDANTRLASPTGNLLGGLSGLADKVKSQAETISDRDNKLKGAEKQALDAITQKDTDLVAKDAQIATVRTDAEAATKLAGDDRAKQQATVAEIQKASDDDRMVHLDSLAKKEQELANRTAELQKLQDRVKASQSRFDKIRVSVTDPILRAGDGVISSLSGKDIVYINLGRNKQIVPGLTFEVYDKNKGIPKINDPLTADQPAGKASIEVIRVLDDNCECRIVRRVTGQTLQVGDIIFNIVYDPSIRYNFAVFGKFDLDRNGVATLQETEIVKRLITQWGAKVSPQISVETDFLVIGKEPVVPAFTQEELGDPVNIKKQADSQKELDDYLNVLQKAKELHIPILNQNRFLFFTGQSNLISR